MKRKTKKAFIITKVKPKIIFLPPKKFLGKRIIGGLLLILGSVVLTSSFFYLFLIPNLLTQKIQKECPAGCISNSVNLFPRRIYFPTLNLELPVVAGEIKEGIWILPKQSVAFLPGVSIFEEEGNLVIFGRNDSETLGEITKIKKAEKVYLFSENQYLVFEVIETKTVDQIDETIFSKTSEKTLTIFSTNDYLKGKRFVVRAQKIP